MNDKQPEKEPLTIGERIALSLLAFAAIGILAGMIWSFAVDTFLPKVQRGETMAALGNLLGFTGMLGGLGMLVYGGLIYLATGYQVLTSSKLNANRQRIRAKVSPAEVKAARKENMHLLWLAAKPALPWLGAGIALIALGGIFV